MFAGEGATSRDSRGLLGLDESMRPRPRTKASEIRESTRCTNMRHGNGNSDGGEGGSGSVGVSGGRGRGKVAPAWEGSCSGVDSSFTSADEVRGVFGSFEALTNRDMWLVGFAKFSSNYGSYLALLMIHRRLSLRPRVIVKLTGDGCGYVIVFMDSPPL